MKRNKNEEELNTENESKDEFRFEELDEEGEELSGKDQIKKLREKIKKLETEKAEYLNGWQRSQADYANREREITKEKSEAGKYAIRSFMLDLMPTLDTYDAARANKTVWESVDANWRLGIEYIFTTYENILTEHGLEAYGKEGDAYEASLHEAVSAEDTDNESLDNKISQVLMRGYKLNGNVLREAKVRVYKLKN